MARKAGKKKLKAKVSKKHVARRHVAKKARRAAPRKPQVRRARPSRREPNAFELGAAARAAGEEKLVDVAAHQPAGAHLDAPSAVAHPAAGMSSGAVKSDTLVQS